MTQYGFVPYKKYGKGGAIQMNESNITAEYFNILSHMNFASAGMEYINISDYREREEGVFQRNYFDCWNLNRENVEAAEFWMIEFSLIGCTVAAMHLPRSIVENSHCSKSVTLSELKKRDNKMVMSAIIADENKKAKHFVETTEGVMALLNNPIKLRVQTAKDRQYGKCWDGPNSYTLIGNYGDTTDFYIIGVLNVVDLFG